ncbi:hypothetical protein IWZ00DRAFT_544631 [Phyllosticta capitalensis]|uniref:FAD-binding FR-type domain-containing protein n=1 Tax=Phyllosticta capitalensis TaxID=121624 RepID=A0ABR1YR62_9PEZI
MSSERAKLSHEERTSQEPRQHGLHLVNVAKIEQVNPDIRLFKLGVQDRENGLKFLPGQWLDVFIPGIPKAGGFTITSTPSLARPASPTGSQDQSQSQDHDSQAIAPPSPDVPPPFVELAVQRSSNPPAQALWRVREEDRAQLAVRVGGSFVWPPPALPLEGIRKVLFVAGGVGINPLISILTHLYSQPSHDYQNLRIHFIYATKAPASGSVLFLDRLLRVAARAPRTFDLKLCLTGDAEDVERVASDVSQHGLSNVEVLQRRVGADDVVAHLGERDGDGVLPDEVLKERQSTVAYVCGPQRMTDVFVRVLEGVEGLGKERVLCEKWW